MNQISPNFRVREDGLACPCCGAFIYDKTFMRRVQILRDLMEMPFYVLSFYRCRYHNDTLPNSVKNSRHLYGDAMDISCASWSGNDKWFFVEQAQSLHLSIGKYDSWFHIDLRPGDPVLF